MTENISPDIIKKTQKALGKYVKKPPLTEKLLKKPPFRFLHDVVITVVQDTGFMKGLFSDEELKSENVKDKDAKIAFLNKLIEAVKTVTKTALPVRSSKVVAGLEPANTNLLLQTIGKAIESKIDCSDYILQLNSGQTDVATNKKEKKVAEPKDDKVKTSSRGKTNKDETSEKPSSKVKQTRKLSVETPKSKTPKDSSRVKEDSKSKVKKESKSKTKEAVEKVKIQPKNVAEKVHRIEKKVDSPREGLSTANLTVPNEILTNNDNVTDTSETIATDLPTEKDTKALEDVPKFDTTNKADDVENKLNLEKGDSNVTSGKHLIRPRSARPKSGDRVILSAKKKVESEPLKPMEMTVQPLQRPKSSLRPPSVRPSSARPGAPRLRADSALPPQETVTMGNINVIVENVDQGDDEETVIIQTAPEEQEETVAAVEVPIENKGHLVEQILEQIQEEGNGLRKKVDIDWEQDALHNKEGAAKEIMQLRLLIQTVTKTANPLGNLMNYLHEDFDAMHAELQMWTETKTQLFAEIYKKKRLSAESNKPLLTQLGQLQEEIKKQEQEIDNISCNILKNDLRIKELISK